MKKINLVTIACLCTVACAFTLVAVNTSKNNRLKEEAIKVNEEISAKYEQPSNEKITISENKPLKQTIPIAPASEKTEEITEEANVEKETSLPVLNGKIIGEYTDSVLVFHEMYGDYRTHNGVDISSPLNSPVMSVKNGIVVKNEFDYEDGYIVEIEHDDGIVSVYKNLDSDKIVKVGQVVAAGETIGTIGQSAVSESHLQPHLHFEVKEDNVEINPSDYVTLTE